MKPLILLLICATAALGAEDPIQILVKKLSGDSEWDNGAYPIINIPKDSNAQEILKSCFSRYSLPDGDRILKFKVKESKVVKIKGTLSESYTAVLAETDHGLKIVLAQYHTFSWWMRIYDAPYPTEGSAANPQVTPHTF